MELLEERCQPAVAGTASGIISGTAFLDSNGSGVFDAGDATLPGVTVVLTGITNQGAAVNATAVTDANGAFSFINVLPGTYQQAVSGFLGGGASVSVSGGQSLTDNFGSPGIGPAFISYRQLLTSSTPADFGFSAPGTGQGLANYRSNDTPTLAVTLPDLTAGKVIDLAGFFTDADFTNSRIRFDTTAGPINVELFDTTAPQTVANFFDYINNGTYNNSIFHRLATGFVLQGGGFTFNSAAHTIDAIDSGPAVPNEFGASNTTGTLAMAKLEGQPNSATNGFFFNLVNNNASGTTDLDTQNGGFTVFAKLVGAADQAVLNALAATPVSVQAAPFQSIPIKGNAGANFPTNTTAANYISINNVAIVKRDEALTYTASSSDSNIATVSLNPTHNEFLTVSLGATSGTATITVTATDQFGAFKTTTFTVTK